MSRTDALRSFVAYARSLGGDERGEAQVFLDRLFQAFGHRGCHEAGAELEMRTEEDPKKGASFAELVWKPVLLLEMKRRGVNLRKHYRQAFDDWARLVPQRPRWVVLCNFDEFWIFDFETQMDEPRGIVSLADLPTRHGPLAFLLPTVEDPVFVPDSQAITRQAVDLLAGCFNSLIQRGVPRTTAQHFTMRTLTALFAQNIGLLDPNAVTRDLEDSESRPRGLFAGPARLELKAVEVDMLRSAAAADWSRVRPEIFGTLFEHSLNEGERHKAGAHFTSPADIMKIVGPTIVDPWSVLIERAQTQRELRGLHGRMRRYKVLDPACGTGNFLYIAYRELKRLEARIHERVADLSRKQETGRQEFGSVTASQFYGIDVDPFAVELAKVTMMIGRKRAIDELQISEDALPLDDLDDNFKVMDAVVDERGAIPRWEPVDAIIGNPPFLDARKITMEHGRGYVERLRGAYPEIPGRADYCVYWFRRAHEHVPIWNEADPVSGRVGLVGTNSIRQNYSREGGLDHVVATGGTIVDAVTSQVWSGTAAVHVSLVNWVKGPYAGVRVLHEQVGDRRDSEWKREVAANITSALTARQDASSAAEIQAVTRHKRCFEGQQPGHTGFRVDLETHRDLAEKDRRIDEIVFQYMIGDSLLRGSYRDEPEYVIDFGERSILDAGKHPHVLDVVERNVLPKWRDNADKEGEDLGSEAGEHQRRLQVWWRLKRRRAEMLDAVGRLSRYIVCVRHTKRPIFEFLRSDIRADSALTVFAFEDDYSFGVLQSSAHWAWFSARCSSLGRTFRYTNDTVFDSFAWPQGASVKDIDRVAASARALRAARTQAMEGGEGGLRLLYRNLEQLPGKNPLRDAHAELDAAVLKAYGFKPGDDVLARLVELNRDIAGDADAVGPGVPAGHPRPRELVSADCVVPFSYVHGQKRRSR